MRVSGSGFTPPVQGPQKAQPGPKADKAEAPAQQKAQTEAAPKDENKTKTFDETPMEAVSESLFEGKTAAAESSEEIEGLFEEEGELDEVEGEGDVESADKLDETEEADAEVEEPDDLDEAKEAPETEVSEKEEEEEGLNGEEEGQGGGEASHQINVSALLDLIPQLKAAPRFRIEETWTAFTGK